MHRSERLGPRIRERPIGARPLGRSLNAGEGWKTEALGQVPAHHDSYLLSEQRLGFDQLIPIVRP